MKKTFNILLIYFLCLIGFVANIKNVLAIEIKDGDLIKSKDSSAVYLIQNGERKVFPHSSVYLSWGYPSDYSTVKSVDKNDLISYPLGGAIVYRDGFVFRFDNAGMPGGFDPSAVFFVSDGKVRPIESASTYMKLFNGGVNENSAWDKVYWIPKDLLENFTYPKGNNITSSQLDSGQLPNGLLIKTEDGKTAIVKDGKLSEITKEALKENRYNVNEKIFQKILVSKVDNKIVEKVEKGQVINSVDSSLLSIKAIDITMLPIEENNINNNTQVDNNVQNPSITDNNLTIPTINTIPLAPTNVIPLAKPSEEPFLFTSVSMASDSDKIINIVFNKNVQKTSAINRQNYTFKKIDGTLLNAVTGGGRIDPNGHPLVNPVRNSDDNKKVTITLGTATQDQYSIPSGTYQLCVSNIKSASGGETLPDTCKQFNVINTIRPTLYDNSSSFEFGVNYLASNKKILLKYSEEMGVSARTGNNYKIREFTSGGVGINSWVPISSISGTTIEFLNNNKDVLITFPETISILTGVTDFMIGYVDGSNVYTPRDLTGNAFKESSSGAFSLIGENIIIDNQGLFLTGDIEHIELIDETHFSVNFRRYIKTVSAGEFYVKNKNNPSGFIPISAIIDNNDATKVIFTISSENFFSESDISSDFGITLSNSIINTITTKDILGLTIKNQEAGEYLQGDNSATTFNSNIGTRIDSFVVVDPNNIFVKFSNDFDSSIYGSPSHGYYQAYGYNVLGDNISRDLLIVQNGITISGPSHNALLDDSFSGFSLVDNALDVLEIPNNGSRNYVMKDYDGIYKASTNKSIFRLLFSPSLDLDYDVYLKTVNKDSLKTVTANGSNIVENIIGVKNEKFAAYQIEKGFNFENTRANYYNYGKALNLTLVTPGSLYNNLVFKIIDDDSVGPCHTFSDNYSASINGYQQILPKIQGDFPTFELRCDINNAQYPLTGGILEEVFPRFYYNENNVSIMINKDNFDRNDPYTSSFDINFSGGSDDVYILDPETANDVGSFLLVKFNKNVDLNTLYNGEWTTNDGFSYGVNIINSMFIDVNNDKIQFNNINIGEFLFDGGIDKEYDDGDNLFDGRYTYNFVDNTLSIDILDSEDNYYDCEDNIRFYSKSFDATTPINFVESKITYIPNDNIKDVFGNGISLKFTPIFYNKSYNNDSLYDKKFFSDGIYTIIEPEFSLAVFDGYTLGYGFALYAYGASEYNGMKFSIIDDNSTPCYEIPIDDEDYDNTSGLASMSISNKITGSFPNFELSCDIDNSTYKLSNVLLHTAIMFYSVDKNILDYESIYAPDPSSPIYYNSGFDVVFSGGSDGFVISPDVEGFFEISFNKSIDMFSVYDSTLWNTTNNTSYGITLPNSLIIDPINEKITFDGLNIGIVNFDSGGLIGDDILILDAEYIYYSDYNYLYVNIINSEENILECDNKLTIIKDGTSFVYNPSAFIKSKYDENIYLNLKPDFSFN